MRICTGTVLCTVHHQLLLKGISRKGRCSTVPALLNNITKSLPVGHIPLACRQPRGGQVTPHSRTLSLLSLEGVVGNVLEIKGHLIYEACTARHKNVIYSMSSWEKRGNNRWCLFLTDTPQVSVFSHLPQCNRKCRHKLSCPAVHVCVCYIFTLPLFICTRSEKRLMEKVDKFSFL